MGLSFVRIMMVIGWSSTRGRSELLQGPVALNLGRYLEPEKGVCRGLAGVTQSTYPAGENQFQK
jgi:hypothetical protein